MTRGTRIISPLRTTFCRACGGINGAHPQDRQRSPGEVVGQRKLETDAVYRVITVARVCVLEVIRAPGLDPGTRVNATLDHCRAMRRLTRREARRATRSMFITLRPGVYLA